MKHLISYLKLFLKLIKTDLIIHFKKVYLGEVIDCIFWIVCLLTVSTYVLPQMGMSQDYGALIATGAVVSVAFWDVWSITTKFISDLDGNMVFQYYLTLPLPSWAYFLKQIVFYSIRGGLNAILILPMSKLILMDKINFSNFSIIKFVIIFISANFFCATLSLIMGWLVDDINNIGHVGIRFLFPMWFLGGSQFPWHTLNQLSPKFAYFCLLNPLIYAMEGMRSAVLGADDFLPFWYCIAALWVFTIIFGVVGIVKLRKKLDCV